MALINPEQWYLPREYATILERTNNQVSFNIRMYGCAIKMGKSEF